MNGFTTRAPKGLSSPLVPRAIRLMSRVHVRMFTLTGGRLGRWWRVGAGWRRPVPTLLLSHRGRTSGRWFTTPLLYLENGRDLVVVASQGGLATHPQWYRNLAADGRASVQIGRDKREVMAHVTNDAERERLWPLLVELYPDFDQYQAWTVREIPVVVLSPR